ncbi:MAG: limonene-1,2-epoxide hydrolase family protein [Solirubrobacteraceae bacterium]
MSTNDPQATVQAFFDRLTEGGHLKDAIDEHLSDDCVWENSGLPAATGKDAIHEQMQNFIDGMGLHALVVDTHAIAVAGNTVLTEREDHIDQADGTRVLSMTMAGTFQVTDGKITRWADYFDPRPLLP